MTSSFYKLKRHRLVSGVLAGLADKFGLSVTLPTLLVYSFCGFSCLYRCDYLFTVRYDPCLIRDEEEQEMFDYGPRPRRRKRGRTHP